MSVFYVKISLKQNINFKSAIEDTMNEEEVIQQYIEQEKIFVLTN